MMHIKTIENYVPKNEQERVDKKAMLDFALKNFDALLRSNLVAHFTNSAIITNKNRDKVLFVNHLIYKSWGWVGGHNDGNPDFLDVVLHEAQEETGIKNVKPIMKEPISIDNIYVPNHIKNTKFVGDHIHMNLTYLLEADETESIQIKKDENSGVRWFHLNEVLTYVTEERMKPIYQKVISILVNLY